jgi:SAM-dependent methyltransferase
MNITQAVTQLYDRFPYTPEPIINMAPMGWNWRWDWRLVHSFVYGYHPKNLAIQILDAGCGTGFETQYLTYQNPSAEVLAADLIDTVLTIVRERCHCAEVPFPLFKQGSLLELGKDSWDFINSVAVRHYLPKTVEGLTALKEQWVDGRIIFLLDRPSDHSLNQVYV